MTDAIVKLTDMHMQQQQRSIEYERQRHLANWLIESSPHMPKTAQCQQGQHKKQKKIFTTSIFHDSFLFLSKFGPSTPNQGNEQDQIIQSPAPVVSQHNIVQQQQQPHTNLSKSPTAFTTSQTNLPLQIVQSSRDGNKPKLRRFNSHDTSANMFSVADFENARLARRNELELVRQKQRYKVNSLSSGCDSSTGDSKGSKLSNESKIINDAVSAESFLERYSLPRIARLIAPSKTSTATANYEDKVNQSSAKSSKKSTNHGQYQASSPINVCIDSQAATGHDDNCGSSNNNNGELFLLYRHLKKNKVYHAFNGKTSGTNRKKGIKIPQDFTGYFSFVNDKGMPTATLYTTMIQLVRERVYKFLSVDNMQAYTESNPSDNVNSKSHYVKTTAKAGEVFRLLAVFEDGSQNSNNNNYSSTKKDNLNSIGREKEKGRYVQLMSESRQIIYVALSTKGKFYEIEHSGMQQMFSKSNSGSSHKSKQLNSDCVHRITNIITDETVFPLNLKFISKHVNGLMHATIPENIKITKVSVENSVIACPIDEAEFCNPLHLVKLYLFPEMKFIKSTLGFENEKIMFSNQNVQNLLKFCQFNCDNFVRAIEYETLPKETIMKSNDNLTTVTKVKSKTSAFTKFFSSDKNSPAHEREDSIIFLSKNDLENLEQHKVLIKENQDKLRVFQPSNSGGGGGSNKKGWFKNLRNGTSSNSNTNPSSSSKTSSFINLNSNSMDRYQDMSKMIQERFGNVEINENPSTLKSSSEISYDLNERTNKAMQKCFSLQNIELNTHIDMQPPDLVATKHKNHRRNENKIERNPVHSSTDSALNSSSNPRQQSFITEKLFNEFYVKTKQYSKSSSSLHQLLHFSVPQKMNIRETKSKLEEKTALMQLQLPPPPPTEQFSENEQIESIHEDDDSVVTDDLPYCSVRDSILHSTNNVVEVPRQTPTESIYAEICASTPPISSSNASEMSYKVEKVPVRAVKSVNNVSSIRISFGQDLQAILSNDSAVKY